MRQAVLGNGSAKQQLLDALNELALSRQNESALKSRIDQMKPHYMNKYNNIHTEPCTVHTVVQQAVVKSSNSDSCKAEDSS